MSVLIAADRNRITLLEERLAQLENRFTNVQQHLLPEASYLTADQTTLMAALQAPVERCLKHTLQTNPRSLLKGFVPVVAPFLRKLIATARQPMIVVLRAQQARLNYLNQYFENLDQALVTQQAQLTELVTQVNNYAKQLVHPQTPTADLELYLNQVEQLRENSFHGLETLAGRVFEIETHLKQFEAAYLAQQAQFHDLEQYLQRLEETIVTQAQMTVLESNWLQLGTQVEAKLAELEQWLASKTGELEHYMDNLEKAVIRHDTQLEEVNHYTTLWSDLNNTLQKQQAQLAEFDTYLDNLEKAHVNQHVQLTQLNNQVGVLTDTLKPLKEAVQVYHTQLATLEQTLDNLEKVQVEQHLQLDHFSKQVPQLVQEVLTPIQTVLQIHKQQFTEVDQYLDNLEKVHVKQHVELNQINQQVDDVQRVQETQQRQVTSLESKAEEIDHRVVNIEGAKLTEIVQHVQQLEKVAVRFEHLEDRITDPKKRALDLADILPEAIRQSTQQMVSEITSQVSSQFGSPFATSNASQTGKEGTEGEGKQLSGEEELAQSMQRPVEICIQQAIKKDVRPFADALFPLIGPTIRRSISEMFKDIVQRINTMLEQSIFSHQGILWRLQAWRTGQSFAEIVLSNTLQYRIDQVFLIHRETGLLMLHAQVEEATLGDRDAVSAMFTAIQDFVRDSFSASKEEELDSVEVGQYTVWIERSPYAILACVVRGDATRSFRTLMKEQLESIQERYGPLLQQFDGDNTKLKYCQPLIDEMLRSELKPEAQPHLMTPQLAVILGVILLVSSLWSYKYFEYQQRLTNYMLALNNTPGIVVISTFKQNGKLIVSGMQDPLATDPNEIAQQFGLKADIVFIGKPYQDLHPKLVEQRLRQWLKPPNTVQIFLQGSVLRLTGYADQAWIDKVNDRVWKLAGVTDIDSKGLINTEAQFQAYLKVLNETPGIMVVSSGVEKGQLVVTGMRDPLAEDPTAIARRMQITDVVGTWRPYQDLAPQFVMKRVLSRLAPPTTVAIHLDGEVLHFHGHASQEWITKALDNARTVSGVNKLDTETLISTDQFLLTEAKRELLSSEHVTLTVQSRVLQVTGHVNTTTYQILTKQLEKFQKNQRELASIDQSFLLDVESESQRLKQNIEKTVIYFSEETDLMSQQELVLQAVLKDIQQLLAYSQDLTQTLSLQVIGNTDGLGTELHNQQLGQRRSEVIINWLRKQGINEKIMKTISPTKIRYGETQPNPNDRNVVFRVLLGKTEANPD